MIIIQFKALQHKQIYIPVYSRIITAYPVGNSSTLSGTLFKPFGKKPTLLPEEKRSISSTSAFTSLSSERNIKRLLKFSISCSRFTLPTAISSDTSPWVATTTKPPLLLIVCKFTPSPKRPQLATSGYSSIIIPASLLKPCRFCIAL